MEFWCLVKYFCQYDIYDKDVMVTHFKNQAEAVDCFNEYVEMYIDDLYIDEEETFIDVSEDSYYFTYSDDDVEIEITLDKIVL